MVIPQLARAVVILQRELDLHLIGRVLVLHDLPFTLAGKAVLRQGSGVGELRKDNGNTAADWIAGCERRGFSHEQHVGSTRGNPRRGVTAVEIYLRGAARRVSEHHLRHAVSAAFYERSHLTVRTSRRAIALENVAIDLDE